MIEGVEDLDERAWPGGCLRVGEALIGVQDLRLRGIMTSYAPDTQAQDAHFVWDDVSLRVAGSYSYMRSRSRCP